MPAPTDPVLDAKIEFRVPEAKKTEWEKIRKEVGFGSSAEFHRRCLQIGAEVFATMHREGMLQE